MNIGIISNKNHAKSHAAALRRQGHQVLMLGGSPSEIPPSIDIVVCRPASSAHAGFDTAMAAKRGGRSVVITNGVKAVLQGVENLLPASKTPEYPGEGKAVVINEGIHTSADALRILSGLIGCYGSLLHTPAAAPVIEALAARKGPAAARALPVWTASLAICKSAAIRGFARDHAPETGATAQKVYSYPTRGAVRELTFFVSDPEALGIVFDMMPLAGTREEAQAAKKKMLEEAKNRAVVAPRKRRKQEPAQEVEVASNSPKDIIRKALTKPQETEGKPKEEKGQGAQPWDTELAAAIALVLAEMRSVNVGKLIITADGSVVFERAIMIPSVQTGSMTVEVG